MTEAEVILAVPGAQKVVEWFGMWPKFHDGEVLSVALHRSKPSSMEVHGFIMTSDLDERGYFKCTKHAVVRFVFHEIVDIDLRGFNAGNILFDLGLERKAENFVVSLSTSYGLEGAITVSSVAVEIEPGVPVDSQFARTSKLNTANDAALPQ